MVELKLSDEKFQTLWASINLMLLNVEDPVGKEKIGALVDEIAALDPNNEYRSQMIDDGSYTAKTLRLTMIRTFATWGFSLKETTVTK